MSKIKEFGLSRLWVEEDFGFQQLVYKELPKMGYETEDDEDEPDLPSVQSVAAGTFKAGVDAKVAAFVAAFEKFDEALKDSEKLASSALVTKADDARDYAWRGVSNYLKAMTMHPDADVAAADAGDIHHVRVYHQRATFFEAGQEFVQRRLVEHAEDVELLRHRRAHGRVGDDDRAVGGAAALFGAVGGEEGDVQALGEGALADHLADGHHALAAEAGDEQVVYHCCALPLKCP